MASSDASAPLPRSLGWLAPLSPRDQKLLASESSHLALRRGEIVFAPSPEPDSVFLLERGLVRIYRLGDGGAEVTLGYVGDGQVLGELAAFGAHPRESFAVAALPSVVLRISRSGFAKLVRSDSDRSLEVTRQIAERLKRAERRVEYLVCANVRARLISILLELAHDFGEPDGKRLRLGIRLSQAELATLIGATRQTVNASLSELRAEGLVALEGGRIVLSRSRALRASLPSAVERPAQPARRPAGWRSSVR